MSNERFGQVAQFLIDGARETRTYSLQFKETYNMPPTAMSKVHHLRSILQASFAKDDSFELSDRRAEFGRVEYADLENGGRYLLKSASAFAIEQQTEARGQLALIPIPQAYGNPDLHLIVFDFGRTDLTFTIAPALEVGLKKKVRVVGQPEVVGSWALDDEDFSDARPFDQNGRDRFDDLGREFDEDIDEQ